MKRLFPVVAISLVLCACSTTPAEMVNALNPFKIDIRQGNYVSQDMVVQLKPGQTKEQVHFILGTPLVMDAFHVDRWDYVYRFQPGRGPVEQRRLIVYFQDNRLVRLGGDVVAGEAGEIPAPPPMQTLEIENPKAKSAPKAEAAPVAQPGGATSAAAAQ